MAIERPRLMELSMVRYRDDHDQEYIYFWIEKFNNDIVSPVFENEDGALNWFNDIKLKMNSSNHAWNMRKL